MAKTKTQELIDSLMDQHGIDKYVDLLALIAKQLGKDKYQFIEKEKDNFSKMLKEKRPLKHEYIIPLEKIFGVPMAKLMYKDEYNADFSREDLPFVKGFRYYAYKDDPKLLKDEFDKVMITRDGDSALANIDEFNMSLLDYVVEYKSLNTLRHLVNKYELKPELTNGIFYQVNDSSLHMLHCRKEKAVDYLVVENDMDDLFVKMYDPYENLIKLKYEFPRSILEDEKFIEKILNTNKIFETLFATRTIKYKYANEHIVGGPVDPNKNIETINPLLNKCIDFALRNSSKYKEQAKKILEFAIKYDYKALEETGEKLEDLTVREFGNVFYKNGYEWLTNIVYPKETTADEELSALIHQLPSIKRIDI